MPPFPIPGDPAYRCQTLFKINGMSLSLVEPPVDQSVFHHEPARDPLPQADSILARLPAEVRRRIWVYLLARGPHIPCFPRPSERNHGEFHPAILRTCRAIYNETIDVLYVMNLFTITCHGDWGGHGVHSGWRPVYGLANASLIWRLQVDLFVCSDSKDFYIQNSQWRCLRSPFADESLTQALSNVREVHIRLALRAKRLQNHGATVGEGGTQEPSGEEDAEDPLGTEAMLFDDGLPHNQQAMINLWMNFEFPQLVSFSDDDNDDDDDCHDDDGLANDDDDEAHLLTPGFVPTLTPIDPDSSDDFGGYQAMLPDAIEKAMIARVSMAWALIALLAGRWASLGRVCVYRGYHTRYPVIDVSWAADETGPERMARNKTEVYTGFRDLTIRLARARP